MEALRQPVELILSIMGLRAYAKAYYAVKNAKEEGDVTDWQRDVVFDVVEEIARRRRPDD